jgi:hypothetical protein
MQPWVIRDGVSQFFLPINFRFAPKADLIASTGGDLSLSERHSGLSVKAALMSLQNPANTLINKDLSPLVRGRSCVQSTPAAPQITDRSGALTPV